MATAAGLPGTYKAWLSDSTSSPSSRFVPSTGPYRLVNGTTIAANWTDLTDGTLAAPINVTETGGGTGDVTYVWTNTDPDGTARNVPSDASKGHCTNWSTNSSPASDGIGGSAGSRTTSWTALVIAPCDYRYHLYCFQQR